MKAIYVNILGNWAKLDKEDLIQNTNAYLWIQENNLYDYDFINIGITSTNTGYKVHISNVVIETKSSN